MSSEILSLCNNEMASLMNTQCNIIFILIDVLKQLKGIILKLHKKERK